LLSLFLSSRKKNPGEKERLNLITENNVGEKKDCFLEKEHL